MKHSDFLISSNTQSLYIFLDCLKIIFFFLFKFLDLLCLRWPWTYISISSTFLQIIYLRTLSHFFLKYPWSWFDFLHSYGII